MPKRTNFEDVWFMHRRYGLPIGTKPKMLNPSDQKFREEFLREELLEFADACRRDDLPEAADALIDLVVVAMGTAVMMGLPWQALWDDVRRANESKVAATSARAYGGLDLIKPEGWKAPEPAAILSRFSEGVPQPASAVPIDVVTLVCNTSKEVADRLAKATESAGSVALTLHHDVRALHSMSATTAAGLIDIAQKQIRISDRAIFVGPIDAWVQDLVDWAQFHGVPVDFVGDEA